MTRDEFVEAGAQALRLAFTDYKPDMADVGVVVDAIEPLIRAEARAEALEFCCEDRAAELRAKIEAHFREYAPPYLFPNTKTDLLPGMERTTVHDAIMDVWKAAEEQILELIERDK